MVSVLTFYSDDPSLNPAKAYSFSVKFLFEKKENKQKEAGVGPIFKKRTRTLVIQIVPIRHDLIIRCKASADVGRCSYYKMLIRNVPTLDEILLNLIKNKLSRISTEMQ